MMKRLLSATIAAATVCVAHSAVAQEALLGALRQDLNEEACSQSRFAALLELEEAIGSLEGAIETLATVHNGPGFGVRLSRQPDDSYRLESHLAAVGAAIGKANAFRDAPAPDSIPGILADAETMLLPDMTSPVPSDDALTAAQKEIILLLFSYNVQHRLAAYCGHEPFGALAGVRTPAPARTAGPADRAAVARAEARAEMAEARADVAEVRGDAAEARASAAEARVAELEALLEAAAGPKEPTDAEWEQALGAATRFGRPDRTSESNLDDGSHYDQSSDDRSYRAPCNGSPERPYVTGFNFNIRSNTRSIHWRWRQSVDGWWRAYYNREHLGDVGERIRRVADTRTTWHEYSPPRSRAEGEFILLIACSESGADVIDVHYHH